jgi:hypothetical protein
MYQSQKYFVCGREPLQLLEGLSFFLALSLEKEHQLLIYKFEHKICRKGEEDMIILTPPRIRILFDELSRRSNIISAFPSMYYLPTRIVKPEIS